MRMFDLPAITWTLTAILLLSGSYLFLQAVRSRQLTDRINSSLHALMNILMAAMLWNLWPSTMLAQITVLAGAALWFIIQAVARPEFKILCAGSQSRLKCSYHSLTMAGAALMVAMMGGHVSSAGHGTVSAAGLPISNSHHSMPAAAQTTVVATLDQSPALAVLLTVFFGAASAVFIVLLLRFRGTKPPHGHGTSPRLSVRAEHGLEALGAAVMALMFAAMSA